MKYFDAFAGIGGFSLGINLAYEELYNALRSKNRGIKENTERDEGQGLLSETGKDTSSPQRSVSECYPDFTYERPLCVGYSEIDKYAIEVYQKHFNHKNYGDITKIEARMLPDFDLLVGGFPCQSFSIAGKRRGFDDTRGTMFFELARIIKEKQPSLFVFENVKGLLSHDEGRTFYTIITTLDELGYDMEWQVLNSKNHGVPQNRERVFIIGHLRGTSRPEVFPFTTAVQEDLASTAIDANYSKGIDNHGARTGIAYSQEGWAESNDSNSIRRTTYTDDMRIRRLTSLECARLQGFPDTWHDGLSDTQAYKCYGNAVTVNVVRDIMKKLL